MEPAMVDGVEPVTRFKIADDTLGWAKLTDDPWPTEKPCQLTTAFWLDWVTSRCAPLCCMVTVPAATLPPVGSVCATASVGTASAQPIAVEAKRARVDPRRIRFADRWIVNATMS